MANEVPKGRIARGLALVKLAARELPGVAGRIAPGDTEAMDVEVVRASAERAVKTLGELRGLAMKVGQTMSYVDGLLPPEATEVYQKTLAALQSQAPTVSFEAIRAEVERGLGRPLDEAFTRFDEAPIAAASIGQVHRASLIDPDTGAEVEVAVKVQFPSIAQAVESDLKNLETLRPMIAVMAPGADTKGGVDEVVGQLAAELDYTNEAENQRRFAELTPLVPGARVAKVYATHTARNVLTMEFVEGRSIRQVADEGDAALRDRVGEVIFRFTLGVALQRGVFNTDPHPGNYLVTPEGEVAFLDFGSVKTLPPELHARWKGVATMLVEGRLDEWRAESADLFGMHQMDPGVKRLHQDLMIATAAMVADDKTVTIDRSLFRSAVKGGIETGKAVVREVGWLPSRAKTMAIPPDFVMLGRMQLGLFAVLAQLRPTANWNRVLKEMLAG